MHDNGARIPKSLALTLIVSYLLLLLQSLIDCVLERRVTIAMYFVVESIIIVHIIKWPFCSVHVLFWLVIGQSVRPIAAVFQDCVRDRNTSA